MSSIYKKGRDGYYYYQAYVYNDKTGRKDKRVFHALSTKNISVAKSKQEELDLRYETLKTGRSNIKIKSMFKLLVPTLTALFFLIYTSSFFRNQVKEDPYIIKKIELKPKNLTSKIDSLDRLDTRLDEQKIYNNQIDELPKTDSQEEKIEKVIPVHSISKVEELSGAFKQVKINVTLDEDSSTESQRHLCETLKKRYSNYSNIIICLYADNNVGKNLANGKSDLVSLIDLQSAWLAMYTFNGVEGEFFDADPSGYLGLN